VEGQVIMAAVGTLKPGSDPTYPRRQIGTASPAEAPKGLDYYLSPAKGGGEPPGVWAGAGLAALGLAEGQLVDLGMFEKLFGEHVDPRDPTGRARLGRAPQAFGWRAIYAKMLSAEPAASRETLKERAKAQARRHPSWEAAYADLLRAEPHATPARQAELKTLAQANTRQARPFWEYAYSVSKSISLLYGGYLAAAEQARSAENAARAEQMERNAATVWRAILAGNAAALGFLQREAGIIRPGHHGGSGAETRSETGRFEDAPNWVIGVFRHHISRAGDPQLHIHNLILNKVQGADGTWLKLDSRTLYRHRRAATEVGNAEMEAILTSELGVAWVPRADGHGREIAGISQDLMDVFSARTRGQIDPLARKIAAEREAETGRAPTAWQMSRIRQDATLRTRPAKAKQPLDIPTRLKQWEATAKAADLGDLAAIPAWVLAAAQPGRPAQRTRDLAAERDVVQQTAKRIAWAYASEHGRAPSRAEYAQMERFAGFITLRGADPRPVDPGLLLRGWQAREQADKEAQNLLRRDIARAQARVGPAPAAKQPRAQARGNGGAAGRTLIRDEARQVMAEAVASLQARRPTWTRADLIARLGECFPPGVAISGEMLQDLAARALAGDSGERVELLSAPEWPRVPDSLRRVNGDSIFVPQGAELYASGTQLGLEAQLLARAQATGAPRLDPGEAARLLGADPARLSGALRADATAAALSQVTGSRLRTDQAAAASHVLTSPRRAEVMIGPAGTGKTRTLTELARIWQQAGLGPAVALTTSSNARNVIREEAARHGVTLDAYNTAEWLGHTKNGREARPPVDLAPGSLVMVDEGSVTSLPDLDAITRRVTQTGSKLLVTGDPMQMQAPEGGGAMALLAHRLGHVQLTEAWRFTQPWEREATTRLRDGDVTVLEEYRQHDRLHAGPAEHILEDAAHAYLHDHLSGKDTLLMAATDAMAAELARRVRDDLIYWGHVEPGPAVGLMNGYRASTGDRIMARKNNTRVKTGEGQLTLANRDVLRITDIDPDGSGAKVEAERLTGRDPATGAEQWSPPFELRRSYLERHAQLAYAVNFHTAEGRTVGSGISVFTGQEDRQAVNVALTRGRENNEAFVITGWNIADPRPGADPDPELARHDQQKNERAGFDTHPEPEQDEPGESPSAEQMLAACLRRDGHVMSATDTREAEWSDADRLDVLDTQWQHVKRQASQQRYQDALSAALGDEQAGQVAADPASTWLWRSLREAEAAGLDGPATLHRAVESGPLTDAGSVAKVLDWRIRQHTAGMPALAARPFTGQVPQTGDPELDRYGHELAAAMDDRCRRLGEHAVQHPPGWASILGPVPEDAAGRAHWEHTAGLVEKYRERWRYAHPSEPIGPKPGPHSPDARQDWQAAAEALGRQPSDLAEHSDGQLWAWRSAFARQVAWAPPYKGDDLALVRGEIRRAQIETGRAHRNADSATTPEARRRLTARAEATQRWEQMVQQTAAVLAQVQAGYDAWETATAPTRERAVAADAELRRRHPGQPIDLLRTPPAPTAEAPRSGEAAGQGDTGQAGSVERRTGLLTPEAQRHDSEPAMDSAARLRTDAAEPATVAYADRMAEVRQQIEQARARLTEADLRQARQAQQKAAEITSTQVPSADADAAPARGWREDLEARQRQAVHHEPMPRVPASPRIRAPEPVVSGPEAAD
jgi:hypothetical protein